MSRDISDTSATAESKGLYLSGSIIYGGQMDILVSEYFKNVYGKKYFVK